MHVLYVDIDEFTTQTSINMHIMQCILYILKEPMQISHPKSCESNQMWASYRYSTWVTILGWHPVTNAMPVSLGSSMHSYAYCHESTSLPYMMRECKQTHKIHSWLSLSVVEMELGKLGPRLPFSNTTFSLTAKHFDFSVQENQKCNL